MNENMNCAFCRMEQTMPQFNLERLNGYILTICKSCYKFDHFNSLMLVSKLHEMNPKGKEEAINEIVNFFAYIGIVIVPRLEMRKIKNHWHCHFNLLGVDKNGRK